MADKYDRLERMRADIQKDKDKIARMQEQVKVKEAKLKEAEASQIVADVGALNLTPEQLGEFLALIQSGQFGAFANGNAASDTSVRIETADVDAEDDFDDMEDIEDEEN